MKVYRVSKGAFAGICLLILTLPVSRQWKLISSGERAKGRVSQFTLIAHEDMAGVKEIRYVSEILFEAEGQEHKAFGPSGYEYKKGRNIRLIYDPDDPSEYCLLTFTGFYLSNYMVLPIVLLVVWAAFYLSFTSYTKRRKEKTLLLNNIKRIKH